MDVMCALYLFERYVYPFYSGISIGAKPETETPIMIYKWMHVKQK